MPEIYDIASAAFLQGKAHFEGGHHSTVRDVVETFIKSVIGLDGQARLPGPDQTKPKNHQRSLAFPLRNRIRAGSIEAHPPTPV